MKEQKKLGLSTKIFIALFLGSIFGLCINFYLPSGAFKDEILIKWNNVEKIGEDVILTSI